MKVPLQRLRAGDAIAMYSPRTAYPDGELLQAFTAIGVVTAGRIYQVQMGVEMKLNENGVPAGGRARPDK